jgi:hypothetical protein
MKIRMLVLGLMAPLAFANCGTNGEGGAQTPGGEQRSTPALQNGQASSSTAAENSGSTPARGATPKTEGTPASGAHSETGVLNVIAGMARARTGR